MYRFSIQAYSLTGELVGPPAIVYCRDFTTIRYTRGYKNSIIEFGENPLIKELKITGDTGVQVKVFATIRRDYFDKKNKG
jgi:hypothetical protein